MFNADAYLAALAKPTFTLGGQTYTGQLVSFHQALALQAKVKDATDPASLEGLVREVCTTLAFPAGSADALLTLPPAGVFAALADFFGCLMTGQPPTAP